jgi:hypothetical protein
MNEIAKMIMIAGGLLFIFGAILMFSQKFIGVGKLPGDIVIKKDNFTFYFPLATSILLSIVLTVIMQVFFKK